MPKTLSILAAAALTATLPAAHAAPQATLASKIPYPVTAHSAAFIGAVAPETILHLVISLPQRNTAQLDATLRDIYNPASPNYHHYLSVEEFSSRFNATPEDYEKAAAFFEAQGLTVSARTPNRYIIDVDGRVADVERVFHVTMGQYRHPVENRVFFAPDRPPTLDLAIPVQQVLGLDNYVLPHAKVVHARTAGRPYTGSGPSGYFTGNDIREAYYPNKAMTGVGQSVGLMELGGYNIADVNNFFAKGYGPSNKVPVIGIKTDSLSLSCPASSCDDIEQALDIEYTISMAPNLFSVRVYVGNSPEDVLNRMASDNLSKILSTSWGWDETFATDDGLFKEFAAQGQTNLTASGDDSSLQASGPWPEEDANIVAVGGTDIQTVSPGGAWKAETGWNGSAGGPSLDTTIKIESYQSPFITTANGGSKTLRNVPDIAANANTNMMACYNGTCGGGNGGTSFASPIWAGIIALANQRAGLLKKPVVGFINPAVYSLAGSSTYTKLFHDQTTGKSGKFSCTPSFDLVTGVGSPIGQAFINALVAY